eukprot:UN06408
MGILHEGVTCKIIKRSPEFIAEPNGLTCRTGLSCQHTRVTGLGLGWRQEQGTCQPVPTHKPVVQPQNTLNLWSGYENTAHLPPGSHKKCGGDYRSGYRRRLLRRKCDNNDEVCYEGYCVIEDEIHQA